MIEAIKQALEALEDFVDVIKYDNEQDDIGRRACCDVLSYNPHSESCKAKQAITAIKEAIREHALYEVQRLGQEIEQEPVAWREVIKDLSDKYARAVVEFAKNIEKGAHSMSPIAREAGDLLLALHTAIDAAPPERTKIEFYHPPQRTWQGLTIDEREQIQQECFGKVPHHVAFAHAVEAKLKEKST